MVDLVAEQLVHLSTVFDGLPGVLSPKFIREARRSLAAQEKPCCWIVNLAFTYPRAARNEGEKAGTYRISTLGSDYDTVLFVLPACGHEVTRCNDDTPNSITSATELRLSEGELLIIDVGVWDAALGSETMPHLVLNITEVD